MCGTSKDEDLNECPYGCYYYGDGNSDRANVRRPMLFLNLYLMDLYLQ